MVLHLNEPCARFPKAAEDVGSDYPNWPYLIFDRKSIPGDFHDLAQRIGLVKTCIINATETARYHWATPLNRYLFSMLLEWQSLRRMIDWKAPGNHYDEERVFRFCARDSRVATEKEKAEAAVFLKSLQLPPLRQDKQCVKKWTKEFIMPLIELREPDFGKNEAFITTIRHAPYGTRKTVANTLRKAIESALMAMARPGG